MLWIDGEGPEDLAIVRLIGDVFGIGPLALEDAVTPDERATLLTIHDVQ